MFLRAFLAVIAVFLVVDLAWIGLLLSDYYQSTIGHLMRETPSGGAAAIFYLAYAAGIVFLASRPAVLAGRLSVAILNGAVLGGLAYGTYTVTNYSIINDWTIGLVVSDTAWGSFLTSLCATCGYLAAKSSSQAG